MLTHDRRLDVLAIQCDWLILVVAELAGLVAEPLDRAYLAVVAIGTHDATPRQATLILGRQRSGP